MDLLSCRGAASFNQIVQQQLQACLLLARGGDGEDQAVPVSVERALRRYSECGILAYASSASLKLFAMIDLHSVALPLPKL